MSSSSEEYSDESTLDTNFIGEVISNKYILLYEIGKGAFATVYLTLNINDKTYYAMKIQHEDDMDSAFEEIDLLKKFSHEKEKYLATIVENFKCTINHEKYVCMVLFLMAGSAYDIMRIGQYSNGMPFNTVKSIIKQLLLGMDVLHSKKYNLLHTDIKPENILVVGQNNKVKELISIYDNMKFGNAITTKLGITKLNKSKISKMVNNVDLKDLEKKYSKNRDNNIEYIDKKYLTNIQVKLADFGNCRKINYSSYDIQTRYYRAPEIILGYKYDYRCDMWSVGCMIYELLTGKALFNPIKTERFNTDRTHIHEMICTLGPIPEKLINSSKNRINVFKVNGQLKGDAPKLEYTPLHERLIKELKSKDGFNETIICNTADLMYKLLNYDPFKRLTIKETLTHTFFS